MNKMPYEMFNVDAAQLAAPVKEFNQLAVNHVEKLVELNLESVKAYAELGVSQLKAVSEVQDLDGLKSLMSTQNDVVKQFGEKLAADARAMVELNKAFNLDAQKLAKENMNAVSAKAA
jgi:phasin family protein